jgi:hypothetical protein
MKFNSESNVNHFILCKTKRSDACILTLSGEYALIDKFLLINDTVYVLTRTFVEMMCPLYAINFPEFTSKVTICNLTDVKKIFLLKEIKKVVAVMINERRYIVSYSFNLQDYQVNFFLFFFSFFLKI